MPAKTGTKAIKINNQTGALLCSDVAVADDVAAVVAAAGVACCSFSSSCKRLFSCLCSIKCSSCWLISSNFANSLPSGMFSASDRNAAIFCSIESKTVSSMRMSPLGARLCQIGSLRLPISRSRNRSSTCRGRKVSVIICSVSLDSSSRSSVFIVWAGEGLYGSGSGSPNWAKTSALFLFLFISCYFAEGYCETSVNRSECKSFGTVNHLLLWIVLVFDVVYLQRARSVQDCAVSLTYTLLIPMGTFELSAGTVPERCEKPPDQVGGTSYEPEKGHERHCPKNHCKENL